MFSFNNHHLGIIHITTKEIKTIPKGLRLWPYNYEIYFRQTEFVP